MVVRIVAGALLIGSASGALAEPGKWSIERTPSLLDSSVDYRARLEADTEVANILDDMERPSLTVACGRDGMYLSIHWPDFVERDSFDDPMLGVLWSLDGAKPQPATWTAVTQAIIVSGKSAKARLAQLATVKRLAVRVPDRHGTQEAAFSLEGIAAIAAEVGPMKCG